MRQLRVDVPVDDAYSIPGLSWVGDAGVPDDKVKVVHVDVMLGADDLVRRLTVELQVNGRSLGTEIDFGAFDADVAIAAPDPVGVVPG